MARPKFKPRAGKGAKARVLTRMIYPRRAVADPKDQSVVILDKEEQIVINRKQQHCFVFEVGGERCYAIQRYVHVVEEGAAADLFDPSLPGPDDPMFQKPKKPKKWRKSKAKKILYNQLIVEAAWNFPR